MQRSLNSSNSFQVSIFYIARTFTLESWPLNTEGFQLCCSGQQVFPGESHTQRQKTGENGFYLPVSLPSLSGPSLLLPTRWLPALLPSLRYEHLAKCKEILGYEGEKRMIKLIVQHRKCQRPICSFKLVVLHSSCIKIIWDFKKY